MSSIVQLQLVGIRKVVSVDYLETVMRCYREGRIAVPIDAAGAAPSGHDFAERITPAPGGGRFTLAQAPIHDDNPAQISFSSGTTGTPKAILLSHRALADVTLRLIEAMDVTSQISEYLAVPPTYSFGLGRARVTAAAGGRLFVPERGFDPAAFARMLEAGEVNALSAVPTQLRLLLANPGLLPERAAKRLRWLEIGSQPMSAEEKSGIRRLFPDARIIQHYGLTEASRTTFLDLHEASEEELASVGRPIGNTEVRIDEEGRIAIRGPHVADGILTADGVAPIVDSEGWLHTNDLGRIDGRGFLSFDGRADLLLNVGGIKVPGELFEQRLAQRTGGDAASIAVTRRADPLRGDQVLVVHRPGVPTALVAEHARAVAEGFGLAPADVVVIEVAEIPRTDTGKVRHGLLAERYGALPPPSPAAAAPADQAFSDTERELAAMWCDILNIASIGRDESFFDVGGDSLSAVSVMLRMERAGVPRTVAQQIFEGRTLGEIAARMDAKADETVPDAVPAQGRSLRASTANAISVVRAALVLVIIANHWSPFILERMGAVGASLWDMLVPIFRMGTPGFAIVFGLGLGYFRAPLARRHPERLGGMQRNGLIIIASGVALLALLKGVDASLAGWPGGLAQWPTTLFFSVLCFYLAMTLTLGPWLNGISRASYPIHAALLTMVLAYGTSLLCRYLWQDLQATGFVELGRLMLVTRYSYPEMLGHTMVGMAIGLWLDRNNMREDLPRIAGLWGALLLIGGIMLSFSVGLGHSWSGNTATLPQVVGYAGAVLSIFALAFSITRRRNRNPVGERVIQLAVCLGLIAFPVYIGHEAVLPLNSILEQLGLPGAVARLLPALLFASGVGYIMWRSYRLYFNKASTV